MLRFDPATGKVTAHTSFDRFAKMISVAYGDGAVCVATDGYDVNRVDPTTMEVTAVETEQRDNQ